MRKILFGVVITLIILFTFKYCDHKKEAKIVLQESSALIQQQINNVGKLIVTEGHFSEVFNYKSSKEIFGDYFTSEKKALIVVNAEITIAYDLSKSDFLNPFEAKDYNDIKNTIKLSLQSKLEKSDLKANAKNRLISELSKFYILTNSLGWILRYNEMPISTVDALNGLK